MRILLFGTVDFPESDAAGQRASLIVKGLRSAGHDASLVILHPSRAGRVAANRRIFGHYNGVPFVYANGQIVRPVNVVASIADNLRGLISSMRLLFRRRWQHRIDAVIFYSPDAIEFSPLVCTCAILRIPVFVEACELMSSSAERGTWRKYLRMMGYKITETILPRLAHGYIVISSSLREYYLKYLPPTEIILVPLLVEVRTIDGSTMPRKYPGRDVILYSGSFAEKDGVPYLLRAFKLIHDAMPESFFVMTGHSADNATMREIELLIRSLRLESDSELTGFLPRIVLQRIQMEASVLLVCRTQSRFASFGFPWKLGEYCLSGRPVVATDIGDISLYFENRKSILLAESQNIASISSCVKYALTHRVECQQIALEQRTVAVKNFEYSLHGKRLGNFIESAIAGAK
jgi:glycosyltransferase involved in cell wall biosynthesis